jgi:hypothetical protein
MLVLATAIFQLRPTAPNAEADRVMDDDIMAKEAAATFTIRQLETPVPTHGPGHLPDHADYTEPQGCEISFSATAARLYAACPGTFQSSLLALQRHFTVTYRPLPLPGRFSTSVSITPTIANCSPCSAVSTSPSPTSPTRLIPNRCCRIRKWLNSIETAHKMTFGTGLHRARR